MLVANSRGRNCGISAVGVTQAAMSGSRRQAAYWRAVSKMPSRVSTAPATVPWSWAATACSPASWSTSTGVRSAGEASQPSTSVIGLPSRAAARNSAVSVFAAAVDQKSPEVDSSTEAVTKCWARRRAPARSWASARMSHHISRGAWAICWGSSVQTVPSSALISSVAV